MARMKTKKVVAKDSAKIKNVLLMVVFLVLCHRELEKIDASKN